MLETTRKCVICGTSYKPKNYNAKYCSDVCKTTAWYQMNREYKRMKKEVDENKHNSRKTRQKSLVDLAVESKKAGMSYGEYVAKMGL